MTELNTTALPQAAPQRLAPAPAPLAFWIALVVACNTLLATGSGHGSDLNFWVQWSAHLQTQGLTGLDANYPPLFVYWLWGVAWLHEWLGLAVRASVFLQLLVNLPVMLAHIGIVALVWHALHRTDRAAGPAAEAPADPVADAPADANADAIADAPADATADTRAGLRADGPAAPIATPATLAAATPVLALAALSPALLADGPMWGQVDAIYCAMLALLLYWVMAGRALLWVLPLFTLALLTKFQSICIAPLLLPLLWHRRSRALGWGALLALLLGALLLWPYARAGTLELMVTETYLRAASLYPWASVNAHNLWFALGLNFVPHDALIFDSGLTAQGWARLLTPRVAGIALFGALVLWVMWRSWRENDAQTHWRGALLLPLGFFMLLPGMHERYLMPAAVLSLLAAAQWPVWRRHALVLNVVAALNIVFILHPPGGALPMALAWFSVLYLVGCLLPSDWLRAAASRLRSGPAALWPLGALLMLALIWQWHLSPLLPRGEWIDATRLPRGTSVQGWGELRVDRSVDNRGLRVAGVRYRRGLGTHAHSHIGLVVPAGVDEFSVAVGVDDEAPQGEVEFVLQLDGHELHRVPRRGGEPALSLALPVRPGQQLDLIVDSLGNPNADHANWLEPRFRRSAPAATPPTPTPEAPRGADALPVKPAP